MVSLGEKIFQTDTADQVIIKRSETGAVKGDTEQGLWLTVNFMFLSNMMQITSVPRSFVEISHKRAQ